jgi:hypothetical protein
MDSCVSVSGLSVLTLLQKRLVRNHGPYVQKKIKQDHPILHTDLLSSGLVPPEEQALLFHIPVTNRKWFLLLCLLT